MATIFYVYEHWRPDKDLPFYVGKGKNNRAYKMKDRNPHHKSIVNKLFKLGMCVEIRLVDHSLTEDEALHLEKSKIAEWRSLGVELCNKTDGGEGVSGLVMNSEARRKMSLAKVGKPGKATMLGKKHTPETRAKMSLVHKGKPKSPEHSAKVGAAHRGKIVSEETKKKLSNARKGKKSSPKTIAAAAIRAWWAARDKVKA